MQNPKTALLCAALAVITFSHPAAWAAPAQLRIPAFTKSRETFTRPAVGQAPSDLNLPPLPE